MIYRCTKDFLNKLKIESQPLPNHYDSLFSWHVKLMKINRQNIVLLVNDETKFQIVLYGLTGKDFHSLDEIFKHALRNALIDIGLSEEILAKYFGQFLVTSYSSTGSKRQLGVLNRIGMDLKYFFEVYNEESTFQKSLSSKMNDMICKIDNGEYAVPRKNMINQLNRRFGNLSFQYNLSEIANEMFFNHGFDNVAFLNIFDGTITLVERESDQFYTLKNDNDYESIRREYFDFYYHFNQFLKRVTDIRFINAYEIIRHGKGSITRTKELLFKFPEIEKQWFNYQEEEKLNKVKLWLTSVGLI